MYQEIDPQDEEELDAAPVFSVLPFIIGAILAGLVFFGVWLMSPGQQIAPAKTVESPASRATYLQALSEPNPAVRRARLMDYQMSFPETDRSDAIAGQLDVINAAELLDWDALNQTLYDERVALADKRTQFESYTSRWDGRLLGGRGDELEALRRLLDETQEVETLPNRTLEPGESPISEEIPADVLAGAPPQKIVRAPIKAPPPPPPPVEVEKDVVIQPSVRRNVSPNYPRSARRRNIGAIVTVAMDIDERGRVDFVETISVETERYAKDFRRAAERAAKRTRFNPKTINGKAVAARDIRKRYIFRAE
jgi:TonB family protein